MAVWSATKARAQFGTLLDMAQKEGPQEIVRGNQRFLVMTRKDYEARTGESMAEFLMKSPLRGAEIKIGR